MRPIIRAEMKLVENKKRGREDAALPFPEVGIAFLFLIHNLAKLSMQGEHVNYISGSKYMHDLSSERPSS
jgi:hypothetical protein